jgi:CRISPR-associated endonuclease/helicase Cas3
VTDTRPNPFLAHVRDDGRGGCVIHDLDEHLRGVARLAEEFAREFGSADWARVAEVWHDLGKYSKDFQGRINLASWYEPDAHLEGPGGRVGYSSAGAQHAIELFSVHGRICV